MGLDAHIKLLRLLVRYKGLDEEVSELPSDARHGGILQKESQQTEEKHMHAHTLTMGLQLTQFPTKNGRKRQDGWVSGSEGV